MISCEEKNKLQSVNRKRDETQKAIFLNHLLFIWSREKKDIHCLNAYEQMKLSVKMEKLLKETYIELQS